jgi:KDO2-lipid IV(A) lauroyltransferase
MLKNLKHLVEFFIVLEITLWVNLLPQGAAAAFGRVLGRVGYKLWGFRRGVAKANLQFCFPDKDEAWVDATARQSFEVFGQAIVELMRFTRYNRRNIRKWVRIENEKCLGDALAGGRGAFLMTGHFGSFELGGAAVALHGYPVTFLAQPQKNRYVERVIGWVRRGAGVEVIGTGTSAAKNILKRLGKNEVVAVVFDQDAGEDGVIVEFFGRPASAFRGPAVLALKTGAAFCCGCAVHDGGPRHKVIMEDVIFPVPRGGIDDDEVKYWSQLYITYLENWCRRRPGLYMWMHRRFKTTAPEIYENL